MVDISCDCVHRCRQTVFMNRSFSFWGVILVLSVGFDTMVDYCVSSVTNYHLSLHNIAVERRSHYGCGRLKSWYLPFVGTVYTNKCTQRSSIMHNAVFFTKVTSFGPFFGLSSGLYTRTHERNYTSLMMSRN
jgi:hypothetical protein